MTDAKPFIPSIGLLQGVLNLKVLDLDAALELQEPWVPPDSLRVPTAVDLRNEPGVEPHYGLTRAQAQLEFTTKVAAETFANVVSSLKAKILLHKLQHAHKKAPPRFELGIGRIDDGGLFIFYMNDGHRQLQFVGPAAQMWRFDFSDLDSLLSNELKAKVIHFKKRIVQATLNSFYSELSKLPLVKVVSWFSNGTPGNPLDIATGLDRAAVVMDARASEIGDLQERLLVEYRKHCDLNSNSRIRDLTTTLLMNQLDDRLNSQSNHLALVKQMARIEATGGLSVLRAGQLPFDHNFIH